MTTLDIDIDALADDATRIAGLADALDGIWRALTTALDAEGPCWGDDEAGRAFAEQYLPAVASMADYFSKTSAAITGIADALGQAAANAVASDDRAQQRAS